MSKIGIQKIFLLLPLLLSLLFVVNSGVTFFRYTQIEKIFYPSRIKMALRPSYAFLDSPYTPLVEAIPKETEKVLIASPNIDHYRFDLWPVKIYNLAPNGVWDCQQIRRDPEYRKPTLLILGNTLSQIEKFKRCIEEDHWSATSLQSSYYTLFERKRELERERGREEGGVK
ncbi:MAG: hypothetical protein HQK50_05545 [Oligoflexia bacterium]|nr:hypothetical protein [Oligoflexia bacterium]MBF0365013.1 hypothetical protein [Oligoflexia bacterium]